VYGFIKLTSFNSQNYYPEILGAMYFINTGLLFKAAWTVCKAFLDDKTKKKIITLGKDYKKKILEHVDIANLPSFVGGECTCEPYGCLYSFAGPWNKEGKVNLDLEEIKKQNEMLASEEKKTDEDGEDDEEREKLDQLAAQLNENMNLSKGQKENAKFKMENQNADADGETPINTQENGGDLDV